MKNNPKRLLILYTELAGYTVACLERFAEKYPETELHLVRWPVNNEAPFQFSFGNAIKIYDRKQYDRAQLLKLADEIKPDAILCSGWIDKDYVRVCRKFNSEIPVVLLMDNKWLGTFKQQIARIVSRFSIRKIYNKVWVPGKDQVEYAIRLGFPKSDISTGFYSADLRFFETQFNENREAKRNHFPHRFIYAGRYYDFKGVNELWNAFVKLKSENTNDWELWCLGTGDVPPLEHPAIRHFGFVQPAEMKEPLKETGVFILPSKVEPWGVVVHEFAGAGFPLLLSKQTGAASAFLREGKNGFSFDPQDQDSILMAMKSVIGLSDSKLAEMGEQSHELALEISPDKWADTLQSLISRS